MNNRFEYSGLLTIRKSVDFLTRKLKNVSDDLNFMLYRMEFGERPDDIYIVTFPRSGTTIMQMILYQLTTDGEMNFNHIYDVSPWIRNASYRREKPKEFPSPRIIKSHDPYSSFDKATKGRFIFVYRNGMDTAASLFYQNKNYNNPDLKFENFIYKFLSSRDTSWFNYTKSWLENKNKLPLLYLRYEDLISDHIKKEIIYKIIEFCSLSPDKSTVERTIERSSFLFMKKYEEKFGVQPPEMVFNQFIRQGKIGEGAALFLDHQKEKYKILFEKIVKKYEEKTFGFIR